MHTAKPGTAEGKPGVQGPRMTADEQHEVAGVLLAEYSVLMASLGAAWSASLVRTSIFLGVLSAAGVALGFAAQGDVDRSVFNSLILVVLPLLLFLGIATFVRLVQVQRESVVYITGMNRIRHFLQEKAPGSRPYLVLPIHDDDLALYRSIGTGMSRRPPRFPLLYMVVQTQGIVAVVTGVVAAAFVGVATAPSGQLTASMAGAIAFAATVIALFAYWRRSLAALRASIRPMFPTPAEDVDARI